MLSDEDVLEIVGRTRPIFDGDFKIHEEYIANLISKSRILVIGGAGSIGQSVAKQLFSMNPKLLHVVDISENNLVELVRDIRSSLGYIEGEFATFVLDFTKEVFVKFLYDNKNYDYVFNLAALKHVRSEKDPYTLMNLIDVNIVGTVKLHKILSNVGVKKYFVVSSDKASAPANLMGASKLLMESFLNSETCNADFSSARFANVAFSDGSLLHGFNYRIQKRQPITAPKDISRYFVNYNEAGRLCIMSAFLGENGNIFYPNLSQELHLTTFSDIAVHYLTKIKKRYKILNSEEEARASAPNLYSKDIVPLYFFESDTTGEKPYEEFTQPSDIIDIDRFIDIGVIIETHDKQISNFEEFIMDYEYISKKSIINKELLVGIFKKYIPSFVHTEKNKSLDEKM